MSYGLKKQISKLDPKMGYFGGPNMALIKSGIKRPNWSHFWRRANREKREEEEKKKKKGRSSSKAPKRYGTLIFGMELWILYGSHGIVSFICLNACLQI